MDAASTAINNLLSKAGGDTTTSDKDVTPATAQTTSTTVDDATLVDGNTTVDKEVAPAVEHETVKDVHETRKQTEVEKEIHQDHYHTTVQPLKDREVEATQHDRVAGTSEVKEFEKDDAAATAAKVDASKDFQNTTEQAATEEKKVDEGVVSENAHVHHHLHETVQPVIEKETVKPSVTHITDHVKEKHHEESKVHGTTINEPISVDEFKGRLDGETKVRETVNGPADTV